eukprot:7376425-Prymnesium_polylepis.1
MSLRKAAPASSDDLGPRVKNRREALPVVAGRRAIAASHFFVHGAGARGARGSMMRMLLLCLLASSVDAQKDC